MKKNLKNTSAKVLAVALAAGMVVSSLPGTVASAKKKVKNPTLGKTKVSITVGKTKKITVKQNKGPKVKKVTIKLSKKQKKLVKITKKTKKYLKVKGIKAGKTTIKVKIKAGKKTYTRKLKVTVTKGKTPVVTPDDKKTTNPVATTPSTGGNNDPATPTPSNPGATATVSGGAATATPSGPVEKTDLTLTYDYKFPAARQVLFSDADSGYPSYGIDLRDYAKVVVKVASTKELQKDKDGWAGKLTLSTTDEGYGQTAYTDGFMLKYFNDLPYEDGVYTFTFDIKPASLGKGWTIDDLEFADCISVQLAGTDDEGGNVNSYDDITLKEIQLLLPEAGVATPTPTPAGDPTPTPVPVEETDTTTISGLTLDSHSDVTTLKASEDADGTNVVRIPFTDKNQRVFFDVSKMDFSKIASIKVTADVPGQMAFDLWSKSLDTTAEKWWNNSLGSDYPFYNASAGEKAVYTFDMSKLKEGAELSDIGYLSLGSHNGPGGKDPWGNARYLIYNIEFVEKEASVTAAAAKSSIEAGETTSITATSKVGDATVAADEVSYTYQSDKEAVATVDDKGVVTAVAAGTAKITVTATIAGIQKPVTTEVEITVRKKTVDASVELGLKSGSSATIGTGLTTTLDVTVRNAEGATVSYEFGSADTGSATVTTDAGGTTATVTGTKAGTVNVTAKITVEGETIKSTPVALTVVDPTVKISAQTSTRVLTGKTITLSAATTNAGKPTVTWSSGTEAVATVSDKGVVTGVTAGTAEITATITIGSKSYTDKIEITVVNAPASDLSFDLSTATALGGAAVSNATTDSVTLTFNSKYNQSVKASVTIPDGVDLGDYYGISIDLADLTFPSSDTTKVTYKTIYVEAQGKDAAALTGIKNTPETNAAIAETFAIEGTDKTLSKETFVCTLKAAGIAKAKTTTGTVELAIGINDIPVGTTVTIKNVKLLKEKPTA